MQPRYYAPRTGNQSTWILPSGVTVTVLVASCGFVSVIDTAWVGERKPRPSNVSFDGGALESLDAIEPESGGLELLARRVLDRQLVRGLTTTMRRAPELIAIQRPRRSTSPTTSTALDSAVAWRAVWKLETPIEKRIVSSASARQLDERDSGDRGSRQAIGRESVDEARSIGSRGQRADDTTRPRSARNRGRESPWAVRVVGLKRVAAAVVGVMRDATPLAFRRPGSTCSRRAWRLDVPPPPPLISTHPSPIASTRPL